MSEQSVRVDTWLWSVRQLKSRSKATAACKAGHVKVNGYTAKPSQQVTVGDTVTYRFQGFDRILEVTKILKTRVGAPIAQTAYIDHSPPRPDPYVMMSIPRRARGTGRPTKRERRALDKLRGYDTNEGRL
ncbi:MAG TPA: RNA-binding S4 domain-containing protein [Actinomyces sp.]|jgi:ribosome-associated heat shock protein Hsp15|nr:RNA-binding S4 domain-containing protein [Acidobacteriota bacterium]HHT40968.1 RNA-binding S4 domain-containing protein [Actinomyces sp.]